MEEADAKAAEGGWGVVAEFECDARPPPPDIADTVRWRGTLPNRLVLVVLIYVVVAVVLSSLVPIRGVDAMRLIPPGGSGGRARLYTGSTSTTSP